MKSLKQILTLSTCLLVLIASISTGVMVFIISEKSTEQIIDVQFTETLKGAKNMLKQCLNKEFGKISLANDTLLDSNGEEIDVNHAIIDEFSYAMNMVATLFVKDGSDFVRTMTTVTNEDGTRAVGTTLDTTSEVYTSMLNNQDYYGNATILGEDYFTCYSPMLESNGEIIGIYFVGIPILTISTLLSNATENTINSSAIYLIPLLIISFLITYFISSTITKRLKTLTTAAKQIADGKFDVEISIKSKNEIGQLAVAFESTVKQLLNYQGYIDEIGIVLADIADGNLTVTLEKQYIGQFEILKINIENLLTSLTDTMLEIQKSSQKVHHVAEQVSHGAVALSQGATEQSATIEALAMNITKISDLLTINASSTADAKIKTMNVDEDATNSLYQMNEMIEAINDISRKSNEIAAIVKTIDSIAFQTNILALNAAVEAARAGEVGKGFAVVANEVRNLATKSADSAEYMATLIEETVSAVEKGIVMANNTSVAIKSLVDGTKSVNTLIDVISISSSEQVSLVTDVNVGVQQIVSVVQTNATSAQESTNISEDLLHQSNILNTLISKFKLS